MIEDIEKLVQIKQIRSEKRQLLLQLAQKQTLLMQEEKVQREAALATHEAFRETAKQQEVDKLMSAGNVGKKELLQFRDRIAEMSAKSVELRDAVTASTRAVANAITSEEAAHTANLQASHDLEKIRLLRSEISKKQVTELRLQEDGALDEIVSDMTPHLYLQAQD